MGVKKRNRTFEEDAKIITEGRVLEHLLQKQAEQEDKKFIELVSMGIIRREE